jgi:hypothetical protein
MDRLSLADLIELANRHTGSDVLITELLLSAAEARPFDPESLAVTHTALERTDFLIYCIPFLPGDAHVAQDRWYRLLLAAFGPQLGAEDGRKLLYDVLKFLARSDAPEVPPALAFALRRFPRSLEGKGWVDQLAARERYLAAGLADIWPERTELLLAERRTRTRSLPAVPPVGPVGRPLPRWALAAAGVVLVLAAITAVVIFSL